MVRFNLICHGLMWFVEEGRYIHILIPEIPPHAYFHGHPNGRIPIPSGADFSIEGVTEGATPMRDLVCARHALLVKRSQVAVQAGSRRNRFIIERPHLVRMFRAAEVSDALFGTTPRDTAMAVPAFSHEVVCFSYFGSAGDVIIKNGSTVVETLRGTHNSWCIYAQPTTPEPAPHDITAMNRLLRVNSTGQPPNYQLSFPFTSDKSHDIGGVKGFGKSHLMNLVELSANPGPFETDDVGCHAGFVVDPPTP